jgi:CAAX prenyl protease-like protein
MDQPPPSPDANPSAGPPVDPRPDNVSRWARRLATLAWIPFLLPFVVFMLLGTLEPTPDKPRELLGLAIPYSAYPLIYAIKIALTTLTLLAVWPGYRQFALRVSPLSALVGIVGVVLWIGICKLGLESRLLRPLGLGSIIDLGQRSAFNPLEYWRDEPRLAYGFLAVRFWGLAIVVPIVEEFFLRGFVMRFVIAPDWSKVPFGTLTPGAIAAGTLVPMALHPGELLAAAVWFTLLTWLMFKTKNIWDCVAAHAVTNLLLGAWVLSSGDWYFL